MAGMPPSGGTFLYACLEHLKRCSFYKRKNIFLRKNIYSNKGIERKGVSLSKTKTYTVVTNNNTSPKDLSRVPQSLSFDTTALVRTYNEESAIIRDILVYASYMKMKNIFGEVEFSIEEFCKTMGYSRTTLQRTIARFKEDPKLIPVVDGHKFDSPFEYALYRAMKENVVFRRKRDGKETFESVQLIEGVEVLYNKETEKRTKRIYNVRLSKVIRDYLFSEYNLIDFNEYRNLRTPKISDTGSLRNFYIFMARMVSQIKYHQKTGESQTFVLSIDDLCSIFSSQTSAAKEKKKYIKKVLTDLQANIHKMIFEWQFVKQNSRFAYFVEFRFPSETLTYFDEQLRAVFYNNLYGELKRRFVISGKSDLLNSFERIQDRLNNLSLDEFYYLYVDNPDVNPEKYQIYKETYERIFGMSFNCK